MITDIILAVGGVGLFLLGMLLLTDGLRELAGGPMRRLLAKYTQNPVSGAAYGALTTAVVQSSSATTVTAIGLVGAGALSFPQALGVIFGANIGTTITGWIVAVFGFKLELSLIAWPVLLVGVLLRMFGGRRLALAGLSLAGFSLLFAGIEIMQQGLQAFEGVVTPNSFPPDTLVGRFQLLLIGVLITLATQSSSAGVATAMVALASGTISFPQAAAMIIGMDVGTTFTAALATIGGSTAMRQTGFAHVIYNILTGIMAFMILGPYTSLVGAWATAGDAGNAQIAVVGFHTFFNTLGVLIVLPFTGVFANFIMRIVPSRGPSLEKPLDRALLKDASVAMNAVSMTIDQTQKVLFQTIAFALGGRDTHQNIARQLVEVERAIDATHVYIGLIQTTLQSSRVTQRLASALHALDHLNRLRHRATQASRMTALGNSHRLERLSGVLERSLKIANEGDELETAACKTDEDYFDRLRGMMRHQREIVRAHIIEQVAGKNGGWGDAMVHLDGMRWLHRVSYHAWRIIHHANILRVMPVGGLSTEETTTNLI